MNKALIIIKITSLFKLKNNNNDDSDYFFKKMGKELYFIPIIFPFPCQIVAFNNIVEMTTEKYTFIQTLTNPQKN